MLIKKCINTLLKLKVASVYIIESTRADFNEQCCIFLI